MRFVAQSPKGVQVRKWFLQVSVIQWFVITQEVFWRILYVKPSNLPYYRQLGGL